jgi:hypothetical protein
LTPPGTQYGATRGKPGKRYLFGYGKFPFPCFFATLREEAGLDALNAELVGMAREAMQPAYVASWLRPDTPPKGSGGREYPRVDEL